jgi:hypothetical protein
MRTVISAILTVVFVFAGTFAPAPLATLAQTPSPIIAFERALAQVNRLASWGGDYRLTRVQSDGDWAIAIAEPVSGTGTGTDRPHSALPLIAVLESGAWRVIVPSPDNAAEFNALLGRLPGSLLDEHERARLQQPQPSQMTGAGASNSAGHKLPWPFGQPGLVAQRDGSGHAGQIDFELRWPYAPGQVVATKPGTVVFVKEISDSGACEFSAWRKTNLVVVQHAPDEFSWYVHLAQHSVPVNVGDAVDFGTTLGVHGETGFACGVHLHYMTSTGHTTWTDPINPDAAPWGTGITATDFFEAMWDGLVVGNSYTSQNRPEACAAPPLVAPEDGAVVLTNTVSLAWAAVADCSPSGYSVRVKSTSSIDGPGAVLASRSLPVTSLTTTVPISPEWAYRDLYWGVRAGGAGSSWSVHRFRIEPTITGVYTLYGGLNFDGDSFSGNGAFPDLVPHGRSDWARSLRIDHGVGVVVCTEPGYRGNCARETGPSELADLDRWVSGLGGAISSIRACAGTCPPGAEAPTPTSPIAGHIAPPGAMVTLRWNGTGDEYYGEFAGGASTQTVTFGWITDTQRTIGPLALSPQPYVWRVRASNGFGMSAWAQAQFVVTNTIPVFIPAVVR